MKRIVIVGAGFAGMWSALSAARLLDQERVSGSEIEIVVVAPKPELVMRPRLYETNPQLMSAQLLPLFKATGIRYIRGIVDKVDTGAQTTEIVSPSGERSRLSYDRLILASGSQLYRPEVPGLKEHGFSIDQIDEAVELEAHLRHLADRPDTAGRNTVAIVGGGFTGIEIACEMPARLREILGDTAKVRVIVIERAHQIGPELGAGPRPVIEEALSSQGVELRLGTSVQSIDPDGLVTTAGEKLDAQTVIWTAGMRASPLTSQIPGERDPLGRIRVDENLRVPTVPSVFMAGDTGCAATDKNNHYTLMSCQHALLLGRSAGNNAAGDLLGLPNVPYVQEDYGTTLDLGPWGAVRTNGWDRVVQLAGADAKMVKRFINSKLIYPPRPNREEAFAAANPVQTIDVEKLKRQMLEEA
jgi:NADH dehydrogenase